MKSIIKTRLAVFLSVILLLPVIVSMLPMTAINISAAENVTMEWYWQGSNTDNAPIQVEKGQKDSI